MRFNTQTRRAIALAQVKAIKHARAEYEAECEAYARRGYRPHHCFHGTNWWVDYDPMCYHCEMGTTDYELAKYNALDYIGQLDELQTGIKLLGRLQYRSGKLAEAYHALLEEYTRVINAALDKQEHTIVSDN